MKNDTNDIKLIRREYLKLQQKMKELEEKNNELTDFVENKIKPSKTYKTWQLYNNTKKLVVKIISRIDAIIIGFTYLVYMIFFFLLYEIASIYTYLFHHALVINNNEKKIDGVSFVIPTWNKKELVIECVKGLDEILKKERPDIPKEIIVLDNGSSDGTYEGLNSLSLNTEMKIIRYDSNLGFARAVNQGANEAKYNYLYLMNNDMIPKKNFFSNIIEYAEVLLKQNNIFFGIASQIFFFDPTKRREESGKTYIKLNLGYLYVAHYINDMNLQKPSITAYVGGGSSLINKSIFQKLGGYDYHSYTPLYVEDLDLSYIAWRKGFPSYFLPSSQIIHHHRSSSKKLNFDPSFYMYKNWLVFILKNTRSLSMIFSHLLLFIPSMIIKKELTKYAIEAMKNSVQIFKQKLKSDRYTDKYTDKQLMDFIDFENKYILYEKI
jgi:GT2 family glycosyltransferase